MSTVLLRKSAVLSLILFGFDEAGSASRQTSQPGKYLRWSRYVEEHSPDAIRTGNSLREFQVAPPGLIAASYISIARISAHTRDGNAT
jgi:hypothetical protein